MILEYKQTLVKRGRPHGLRLLSSSDQPPTPVSLCRLPAAGRGCGLVEARGWCGYSGLLLYGCFMVG